MPRTVSRVRALANEGRDEYGDDEPVITSNTPSVDEHGRLIEFYVITGQQLNDLLKPKTTPVSIPLTRQRTLQVPYRQELPLVPALNNSVDAVLNRSNRIANNHQDAICTYIEELARSGGGIVEAVLTADTMRLDLQRPLIVDSIPTKRPSGYYVRAMGTPEHDEKDDIIFHDSLRVAQALLQMGMPRTYIQNTQILDQLQADEQTEQQKAEQTIVRNPDRYQSYRMNNWQTQQY